MTDWKWRLMLFVRAVDVTAGRKAAFGQAVADNGSGEALSEESKMFDSVVKLSISGSAPAQVYGVSMPVKLEMRNALKALLEALPQARYVITANTDLPEFADAELVATNFSVTPSGQIVQWADALAYLGSEFGLQPIEEAA